MGASGWAYFVPYQEDIKAALQQLRRDIFTKGEYVQSWSDGEYVQSWSKTEKIENLELEPATIDEKIEALLLLEEESGTHSILDMLDISAEPDLFYVTPFSDQDLLSIFETEKPTREMVIDAEETLMSWRGRWEGSYLIVYKDNQPHEIYFTGFSGD